MFATDYKILQPINRNILSKFQVEMCTFTVYSEWTSQAAISMHCTHSTTGSLFCVELHTIILIFFLMTSVNHLKFADVFVLSSFDEMVILLKALHTEARGVCWTDSNYLETALRGWRAVINRYY